MVLVVVTVAVDPRLAPDAGPTPVAAGAPGALGRVRLRLRLELRVLLALERTESGAATPAGEAAVLKRPEGPCLPELTEAGGNAAASRETGSRVLRVSASVTLIAAPEVAAAAPAPKGASVRDHPEDECSSESLLLF